MRLGQSAGRSSGNPTNGQRTPQMARRHVVPVGPVEHYDMDLDVRRSAPAAYRIAAGVAALLLLVAMMILPLL